MIGDMYLRLLFIPALGVFLPLISGIITYRLYSVTGIIGANLYFIFTSFVIWRGWNWIHARIRPLYTPMANPFLKMATVCFASALYGASVGIISTLGCLQISKEIFDWNNVARLALVCSGAI